MSMNGRRAFSSCDVKRIEFKTFVEDNTQEGKTVRYSSGNTYTTYPRVISENPSEDTRKRAGYSAVLHCPRTEDDQVQIESEKTNHTTRSAALRSVRSIAGKLVCDDCRYSEMTPVEVSISRKDFANAEAERLVAYKHLEEGRREIASAIAQTQM